jgi:polysaccharide export outer membrane protein
MNMKFKQIVVILFYMLIFIQPISSYGAESVAGKTAVLENIIQDNEIIKLLKSFAKAYKTGDTDAYITFYAANVLENGVNTLDKIKADYLYTLSRNVITVYEFELSDIKNLEGSAIVDTVYNKTLVEKSKGDTFITSGNVRLKVIKENNQMRITAIDYDKYIKNDYIIGPEDVIEVSVWKSPDLSTTIMVRPDGMISLPLIGDIQASSHTAKELKEEIEQKLTEYKQDPIVSIIVKEANSQAIYVTGEVSRPGKYPLRSETTIVQAITLAGGFTQWADKDQIVIIRKSPMNPEGNRFTLKYSDIVSGKNMKANILLKAGDTVIIP